jgi:uncharacterized YccA/Bax inhibitor family protein
MSNPVFSNSGIFGDPRRPRVRAQQQAGPAWQAGTPGMDAAQLRSMYDAPAASAVQMRRMTYDDVIVRTGGLLSLLVVVAAATWFIAPGLYWLGMIVGLVLGLVNMFKRTPSPALIIAYAVAEGVFLGGISYLFQNVVVPSASGGQSAAPIVMQAILATMVTFAVSLWLFRSGRVRVTPKFTRWLLIAMVGYMAFSLLNLMLSFFLPSDGFGPLRNGVWGLVAGLVAVGLAAASLIVDFDSIKRGVDGGAPVRYAWSASFGLLVTLVWLYLELLRLFAMLSGRD